MAKPKDFDEKDYEDPKLAYYALAMMLDLSPNDQMAVAANLPALDDCWDGG